MEQSIPALPGRARLFRQEGVGRTRSCWVRRSRCCRRWLFSTFQLSGVASQRTFTTALQKYITIPSILPRQADKTAEGPCGRQRKQRSRPTCHKQASVRGGCLGAEGRRRTRRPAKRSGGAACERLALRFLKGQPLQWDVWRPPAEPLG